MRFASEYVHCAAAQRSDSMAFLQRNASKQQIVFQIFKHMSFSQRANTHDNRADDQLSGSELRYVG